MFGYSNEQFQKILDRLLYPKLEYRSIKKDFNIEKNVNFEYCSECAGECCKRCGCHFSPDDFPEISFEALKSEIEKGYISIDYVDGDMILRDDSVYILRIRNQDAPIVDIGLIRNRTPCSLLTSEGCKLDYNERPTGGKLLIPAPKEFSPFSNSEERHCFSKYDIEDCCYEWLPHKKILAQLVEYFKDKDYPCSL